MKKTIFSGIQPTGVLHIGNYLGAMKNWVELQKEYKSIFCVVDLHALTVHQDPKELTENTINTAITYLACGINPKENVIFVQSHVHHHAELAWLLNTITKIPELERMTQFKDKSQEHRSGINMGLFDYPVLMAADILLYQTEFVPVGDDQKQHVELARAIAQRFNQTFGETFKVPNALVYEGGARIMGLDDPMHKMSKSAASANNYISLSDNSDIIRKKIMKAVTDSGSNIEYSSEKPALANLINIYHCFSGMSPKDIEAKYTGEGYAKFKEDLGEILVKALAPIQEKQIELAKDKKQILGILEEGALKAESIAEETLKKVKEKMGLLSR